MRDQHPDWQEGWWLQIGVTDRAEARCIPTKNSVDWRRLESMTSGKHTIRGNFSRLHVPRRVQAMVCAFCLSLLTSRWLLHGFVCPQWLKLQERASYGTKEAPSLLQDLAVGFTHLLHAHRRWQPSRTRPGLMILPAAIIVDGKPNKC